MGSVRSTPQRTEASDEELMRHLAAGRQEALGPLYSRYAPLVFGLAVRSLDRPAAEEVVQDVLLAVWRAAGMFDPGRGPVRPWVLQIAHHRILNELRRRSRQPRLDPDPEGLRLLELPDHDPDPSEVVWREEHRAAVRAALAELPPPQQQAVGLAFFGGLTHEEVARTLDLPLGTAKTRIRAGLQKLRISLAPLVAAVALALTGLLAVLGVRYHADQNRRERDERALALVTTSETSELHMSAAAGAPAVIHGAYRGRAGVTTATVSASHFQPAPAGQHYQAWARYNGQWVSLGAIHPDTNGSALLIVEQPVLATLPEIVEITLESGTGGAAPRGQVMTVWTAP